MNTLKCKLLGWDERKNKVLFFFFPMKVMLISWFSILMRRSSSVKHPGCLIIIKSQCLQKKLDAIYLNSFTFLVIFASVHVMMSLYSLCTHHLRDKGTYPGRCSTVSSSLPIGNTQSRQPASLRHNWHYIHMDLRMWLQARQEGYFYYYQVHVSSLNHI